MITNQAYLFLIFIMNGLLIGFLFDVFRILRLSFKTTDFVTYIEDIAFWIITGAIILYSIFIFNNGEIRLYLFLGIAIGVIFYMMLFSSHIVKFNVYVIKGVKKVFYKIYGLIKIPFILIAKCCKRLFSKPISIVTINLKKGFRQLYNKIKIPNFIRQKNTKIIK